MDQQPMPSATPPSRVCFINNGLPPKVTWICIVTMSAVCFLTLFGHFADAIAIQDDIRSPAVAGRFYPENPDKLRTAIQMFLSDSVPPASEPPITVVSPHAGYIFSGQIMADAFAQAKGHAYDLIVILGVNHSRPGFDGVSVFATGGFQTPLGIAAIDSEAARRLMERFREAVIDKPVHQNEHSIEVLVPFVQVLFPDTPILPVIVSLRDDKACTRFGESLAQSLVHKNPLIVASSDLSHYPKYGDACRVDRSTLQAMASLDIRRFQQVVRNQESLSLSGLSTCACGDRPVAAAMAAAKHLGASSGRIVSYANSGESLGGKRDQVVGYGAVAFYRHPTKSSGNPFPEPPADMNPKPLLTSQQQVLLQFARKTLIQYLKTETIPLPRFPDPLLYARQGAFVTLKRHGELRGCIGHMENDLPLGQVVGHMTLQAAFNDRRFSPLKFAELDAVEIEVSVLTPFQRIDAPGRIVVGRDGVMLQKAGRSAVFLPQVAPEQGWGRDEMLAQLSRKAGLSPSAWKEGASLYIFQAQVFSESSPRP